jgi:hypothetical protein
VLQVDWHLGEAWVDLQWVSKEGSGPCAKLEREFDGLSAESVSSLDRIYCLAGGEGSVEAVGKVSGVEGRLART